MFSFITNGNHLVNRVWRSDKAERNAMRGRGLTSMKRWIDFATFLANFERVLGPGGERKSLVGICLLQALYLSH